MGTLFYVDHSAQQRPIKGKETPENVGDIPMLLGLQIKGHQHQFTAATSMWVSLLRDRDSEKTVYRNKSSQKMLITFFPIIRPPALWAK